MSIAGPSSRHWTLHRNRRTWRWPECAPSATSASEDPATSCTFLPPATRLPGGHRAAPEYSTCKCLPISANLLFTCENQAALNDDEGDVEDPCRDTVPRTATLTVSTTTPMMTTTTAASDRHGGGAEDDARGMCLYRIVLYGNWWIIVTFGFLVFFILKEKFPGQLVRRTSSSVKRASRPHNFVSKVILKQESCVPCKNRCLHYNC